MSHDPEIERALTELAELSRRVADLAATVSALAARRETMGDEGSHVRTSPPMLAGPPPSLQSPPHTAATAQPHWGAWQPSTGVSGPPQPIAFQPVFLTPAQTAAMFSFPDVAMPSAVPPPERSQPEASVLPKALGPLNSGRTVDGDTAIGETGASLETPLSVERDPSVEMALPVVTSPSRKTTAGGSTSKGHRSPRKTGSTTRKTRRPKPVAAAASGGWRRLLARGQKRKPAKAPAGEHPSSPSRRHDSSRRRLGPLSVSVALHAAALVALATVFIVREAEPEPMVITSSVTAQEPTENFAEVELEPVELTEPVAVMAEPVMPELADLDMAAAIDETSLAAELVAPAAESLLDDTLVSGPSTSDLLAPLGGGAGGAGGGGGAGGASGMGGGASMFFGKAGSGKSVCFMCDNSRSYEDGGFEMVVAELMRAVASLQPSQSFFVVFFSDEAYPMFYPDEVSELLPATPENKQKLQAWLSNVETRTGGRGIGRATDLATELAADTIYFLSDGDYTPATVERLVSSDFGGAVVHTFGMQAAARRNPTPEQIQEQLSHNQNLIRIAESHGGSFTPVITPPQAAAAARMRAAAGP